MKDPLGVLGVDLLPDHEGFSAIGPALTVWIRHTVLGERPQDRLQADDHVAWVVRHYREKQHPGDFLHIGAPAFLQLLCESLDDFWAAAVQQDANDSCSADLRQYVLARVAQFDKGILRHQAESCRLELITQGLRTHLNGDASFFGIL